MNDIVATIATAAGVTPDQAATIICDSDLEVARVRMPMPPRMLTDIGTLLERAHGQRLLVKGHGEWIVFERVQSR